MTTIGFPLVTIVRRLGLLAMCTVMLVLTGCAAVAPTYQPTNDNVRNMQTLPGSKVGLGEFTVKSSDLNHISIRAGSYTSPYNGSYAEYLKAALRSELESAGKLDAKAPVLIIGELQTNQLDAAIGTGNAHISARIIVKHGTESLFDKVVHGDSEWESSFIGAVAIPLARQQYADTMKKLIANLIADPDFKKALLSGENGAVAIVDTNISPAKVVTQSIDQQTTTPPLLVQKSVPDSPPPLMPAPKTEEYKIVTVAAQEPSQIPTPRTMNPVARTETTAGSSTYATKNVDFVLGTSSSTVEKMGKEAGCISKQGAGLITDSGALEKYQMTCEDGTAYLAQCEFRQCKQVMQ